MFRSRVLGLLAVAACRGGGTGPAEPAEPDGDLVEATFVVTDSISSGVIAGATVLAGSNQGVTGADGRVVLQVPIRPVDVSAVAAGYDAAARVVTGGAALVYLALRPAAPRVAGCRVSGTRLVGVAFDYAGRKTILRRARSEVFLEGPAFGSVTVPVLEWTWKAVDTWSYLVTVPLPAGEVSRATWRVYDRELNVEPIGCDPGAPVGLF